MVLRKKLVRHGNSYALILDKPILDLLGIGIGDEVELRIYGRTLVITPASGIPENELNETLDWITKNHGETMRRLAG